MKKAGLSLDGGASEQADHRAVRMWYKTELQHCSSSIPLWIQGARFEQQAQSSMKARSVLELGRMKNLKNPQLWLEATRLEQRNSQRNDTARTSIQECAASLKCDSDPHVCFTIVLERAKIYQGTKVAGTHDTIGSWFDRCLGLILLFWTWAWSSAWTAQCLWPLCSSRTWSWGGLVCRGTRHTLSTTSNGTALAFGHGRIATALSTYVLLCDTIFFFRKTLFFCFELFHEYTIEWISLCAIHDDDDLDRRLVWPSDCLVL